MEAKYYLTCLWPGLAELWWRGRLSAIPTAIAFGFALNLLLVNRYLYPHWMSSGLVSMAFWVGAVAWVFYVVRRLRELPLLIAPRQVSDQPDRFPEAQRAYLREDWAEAESLLTGVLAIEPRDPPALLLLTGVYRQTERLEAAELLLAEIGRLEVADPWWLEVAAESSKIDRAKQLKAPKKAPNVSENDPNPTQKDAAEMTARRPMAA
jgi:hypothetical protein